PEVKAFLALGFKGILRDDVRRDGALVGALSLMSTRSSNFTAEDAALLHDLPLEQVVVRAMDAEDLATFEYRSRLASTLNRCTSVQEASDALAAGILAIYGCAHASVFRVDDVARLLTPIALWNKEGGRQDAGAFRPQPFSEGIVGRTV